jgi:hypothetical protein
MHLPTGLEAGRVQRCQESYAILVIFKSRLRLHGAGNERLAHHSQSLRRHQDRPHGYKDDSLEDADALPEPQDLTAEAITELEAVVGDLREIVASVEKEKGVEK